jgi:glutathione peroxidase
MRVALSCVAVLAFALAASSINAEEKAESLYSLKTTKLDGKEIDLSEFKGKVVLVVNVASECGFTKQYAGLQKLHSELHEKGFSVLGFPSNEFGGQEPGSPEEIQKFCESKYSVTFPMFSKVVTKPGKDQSPVYQFLTKGHDAPSWNFCKYLVGKDGKVVKFYPSKVAPDNADLHKDIEAALK